MDVSCAAITKNSGALQGKEAAPIHDNREPPSLHSAEGYPLLGSKSKQQTRFETVYQFQEMPVEWEKVPAGVEVRRCGVRPARVAVLKGLLTALAQTLSFS
jgi:hypothetical protein